MAAEAPRPQRQRKVPNRLDMHSLGGEANADYRRRLSSDHVTAVRVRLRPGAYLAHLQQPETAACRRALILNPRSCLRPCPRASLSKRSVGVHARYRCSSHQLRYAAAAAGPLQMCMHTLTLPAVQVNGLDSAQPTAGDQQESAAKMQAQQPPPRKRGRPRKVVQSTVACFWASRAASQTT